MAILTACGDDVPATDRAPSEAAPAQTVGSNLSSSAPPGSTVQVSEMGTSGAVSEVELSANAASRSELAAAFGAAGISNASKWAREVEEYRPHPEDYTDFTKLRGELAKYNPASGLVYSIIELLQPP